MSPADAIAYARKVKASWPPEKLNNAPKVARALIAILDHGDRVEVPDFDTTVAMVAANIDAMGESYIEIAVDPKTKEVGWTFTPTIPAPKTGRN